MAVLLSCMLMKPPDFEWTDPWLPIADEAVALSLLAELEKEAGPTHCLFHRAVKAVARRCDCDDVLFLTNDPDRPLAVVHLTWRGEIEPDPLWPHTIFFLNWNDWRNRGQVAQ